MATTILIVKIDAPCGEKEFCVDSRDAAENPALFLEHVMSCVEELIPAGEHATVTYLDDKGDACTLLEQSVFDALCTASCGDGDQATVSVRRARTWISRYFVQLASSGTVQRRRPGHSFADITKLDFKVLLLCVQVDGCRRAAEDVSEYSEACAEANWIVEDSKMRARADMRAHLRELLCGQPRARYEEWIADYHPDNVIPPGRDSRGLPTIDRRFYAERSDHRAIWNEHVSDPARRVSQSSPWPAEEAEAGVQGTAPAGPASGQAETASAARGEGGIVLGPDPVAVAAPPATEAGVQGAAPAEPTAGQPEIAGVAQTRDEPAAEPAAGRPGVTEVAGTAETSDRLPGTEEQRSLWDACRLGDFERAKQLIAAKPMLIKFALRSLLEEIAAPAADDIAHREAPAASSSVAAPAPHSTAAEASTAEQHSFLDVCKLGNFKKAKQLIDAKPMLINTQPESRWSALHHFALRGHEEAVRYLLDRGADPSALNANGATPAEVADDSVLYLFVPGHEGGLVLGPAPVVVAAEPAAECVPAEAPSAADSLLACRRQSFQEDGLHGEAVAGVMASTDGTCCLESLGADNVRLVESYQSLVAENSRIQKSVEASLQEAAREQRRLEHEVGAALARNAALLAERERLQASLVQARQQLQEQSSQVDGLQRQLATAVASVRAAAQADEGPSASAVSCELVVGVEVHENEGGCGNVTEELGELVAAQGARSAFRLGSVCLATVPPGTDAEVEAPVCAQVKILNNGASQWPATAAVVCRSGPDFGVPLSAVGPLGAGEATETTLDLMLPPRSEPLESRTVWALVDVASGCPLGPLLVLDAAWQAVTA